MKKVRVTKRQKFVTLVATLSLGLFFSEYLLGKSGFFIAVVLSLLSGSFFLLSVRADLHRQVLPYVVVLPVLYTLAVSLFYFLVPARFLTRVITTGLYAFGLYSLFLSLNIFVVGSIRTIALLTGARIVSLVVTMVSFFLLARIIFSFPMPIVVAMIARPLLVAIASYVFITHALWTVALETDLRKYALWAGVLSILLAQVATLLGFWPTSSTVVALFLTGFFYTIVGLSQAWLDRRLFKGVIWEYVWVSAIVFALLVLFTQWRP